MKRVFGLVGTIALLVLGCIMIIWAVFEFITLATSETKEDQVKRVLQKEGVQGGIEPVVTLTKTENGWKGTAVYGEVIYDIKLGKHPKPIFSKGEMVLARRKRMDVKAEGPLPADVVALIRNPWKDIVIPARRVTFVSFLESSGESSKNHPVLSGLLGIVMVLCGAHLLIKRIRR
jgi:hypothetical protein